MLRGINKNHTFGRQTSVGAILVIVLWLLDPHLRGEDEGGTQEGIHRVLRTSRLSGSEPRNNERGAVAQSLWNRCFKGFDFFR